MQKLLHVCAALTGLLFSAQAAASVIYSNDFQAAVGLELSSTSGALGLDTTPTGRSFLGRLDTNSSLGLNNETVTLSLSGLSAHSSATVFLDLFIIHSPVALEDPVDPKQMTLGKLIKSLLPEEPLQQQFMRAYVGADEPDSLGYSFHGDSVYNLSYTFAHTASSLTASFTGLGLQGITDESWGIDNLRVDINANGVIPPPSNNVPEPASLALLGLGLAGLAAARRRKAA